MASMASVVVAGIGFEGRHGATAPERRTTRRFEVDVEIETDLSLAARTDRLTDTLDFREISELVVDAGTTGEPHHLLESLARKMVEAIGARFPGARVRIELRKLAPPYCTGNPTYAAVRLSQP
jgi:dihydroneopterin aldolase